MDSTIVVLLIAAGGAIAAGAAVLGAFALADAVFTRLARRRDANEVQHSDALAQPLAYGDRPASPRRSGAKTEHRDSARVQHLIGELQRTRSILLGWLSVLELFALGDAWRATALRAELGDLNTCDITLVGDANVIATYQMTVDMLRSQAGRGLPPEVASEMASIRVRLLTALAAQERRLNHGEAPIIASPLVHLDLWGPPRPITEVTMRPPDQATQTPAHDLSTSYLAPADLPAVEPPDVVRPVAVRRSTALDAPAEGSPSTSLALVTRASPSPAPEAAAAAPAAAETPIARRARPRPGSTKPTEEPTEEPTAQPAAGRRSPKAPVRRTAAPAAAAVEAPPPLKATTGPAVKSIPKASTKPATAVEAVPVRPARRSPATPAPLAPTPRPTLAPHLVPSAVPTQRPVRTVAKPPSLGEPRTVPVAVSRPAQLPASRPVAIGAVKPVATNLRPAARATLGPISQSSSSPGGKAPARPTSKRSTP